MELFPGGVTSINFRWEFAARGLQPWPYSKMKQMKIDTLFERKNKTKNSVNEHIFLTLKVNRLTEHLRAAVLANTVRRYHF